METATAGQIVNDVAPELAWLPAEIADVYASTDPNIILLRSLLKRVGRSLVRARNWTHLERAGSLATSDDTENTPLPADFARLIDGTVWHVDTESRVFPADAQTYHAIQTAGGAGAVTPVFRIYQNQMWIQPIPDNDWGTVTFKYVSSYWVGTASTPPGTKSLPEAHADVCLFDANMLTEALKLTALKRRGMATPEDQRAFDDAYAAAAGGDGAHPVLSVTPSEGFRMLDEMNLPETGFGS